MKRCKNPKCGKIFYPAWNENRSEYCSTCRDTDIAKRRAKDKYENTHENRKIGNSAQDREIMSFLKKKKKQEDNRYGLHY